MSIISSMTIGASGLRAESDALSAVSDNIANVNTVGFKRERAVFEDVLGRSVMGSTALTESGAGSRVAQIQELWTQGALVTTGVPTDLALSGDGLFVVNGSVNGQQGQFYTRNGQFQVDSSGYLVTSDGLRLQGYTAAADGTMGTQMGDLRVDGMTLPATPTGTVTFHANLDSRASVGVPFDPANPDATSDYAQTTRIVDSLGQAHDATVYFHNDGGGNWTWHAMVDGGELTGGTAGVPTECASGSLAFDTSGALTSSATTASSFDFVGAAAGQSVTFDFGTPGASDASTQQAQASNLVSLSQDGFSGGPVAGYQIGQDGTITGTFANGDQRALGQVVVARFASDSGLARTGQNLWSETADSGEPLIGVAGTGGRGSVVSGSLEQSNVDLGTEFVDLIAYQRGFSANSKVITTADEMYQELVALKR